MWNIIALAWKVLSRAPQPKGSPPKPPAKPGIARGKADRDGASDASRSPNCKDCGNRKSDPIKKDSKLERQMQERGWTAEQIEEAVERGAQHPAVNNKTGGAATRYVHPQTGRSVVIDNQTKGLIHVGGDGFKY